MCVSDCELVLSVKSGEIHRFAEIVERYDRAVQQYVSRRLGDAVSRQDIVQEVFYRAFKNLPQLDDAAELENWLLSIARNCVIDHYRRISRRESREELDAGQELHHLAAADGKGQEWIWDEVNGLTDKHAQILTLRYRQNLNYQQIASQLQVPVSTVRGRIYEARRSLRQRLEKRGLFP